MGKRINGLDPEQIQGMVNQVKQDPRMAKAKFKATTTWRSEFNNEAVIQQFWLNEGRSELGAGRKFTVVGGHPPELLGTDSGPSSVELALAALGHCIAAGFATYGAAMGIPIDSLVVELEGDIDLQGMLALPQPGAVRPGFQEIRAKYYVKSSGTRAQLEKVAKMAEDLSPTKDSLRAVKFSSQLILQ